MAKEGKWKGVSLDLLARLRLKYCRVQTRNLLRPTDTDAEYSAGGMVAKLQDRGKAEVSVPKLRRAESAERGVSRETARST